MINFLFPQEIMNYFNIPIVGYVFIVVRLFSIFLCVFFFFMTIYSLLRTTWLKRMILWDAQEFLTYHPHGVKALTKQWVKIKSRLDTGVESEFKLSLIEADSLLNEILKRMGYSGDTLGEKLEKLTVASLPNIDDVKEAHQSRNNIVHDPDYRLTLDEAKSVIASFEKALVDLQAL